jgi:hypothetical protein
MVLEEQQGQTNSIHKQVVTLPSVDLADQLHVSPQLSTV